MINRLDPHQAQYFVKPDWGPICLQKLSAEDTSKEVIRDENLPLLKEHFLFFAKITKKSFNFEPICPNLMFFGWG